MIITWTSPSVCVIFLVATGRRCNNLVVPNPLLMLIYKTFCSVQLGFTVCAGCNRVRAASDLRKTKLKKINYCLEMKTV